MKQQPKLILSRSFVRLSAAAIMLCWTATAMAQQRPIDMIDPKVLDADKSWKTLESLANCMAERNPRSTMEILSTLPSSDAQEEAYADHEQLLSKCMIPMMREINETGLRLSFSRVQLRGVLAEAMLDRSSAWKSSPAPAVDPSLMNHFESRPSAAIVAAANRATYILYDIGVCVAASNWPSAVRLLDTMPRSDVEQAAVENMADSFAACVPATMKVKLEAGPLRGVVAEAILYRLNKAQYSAVSPERKGERNA
ncbi:hypothetical protein ACFQRC_02440 [Enterovirga sp. GCM10030262]|uniref:hypothetical protein n=1 Tax=Enterovirga sp. GCM10030262 TaxID=3273391 RepID=UPI00361E4BD4